MGDSWREKVEKQPPPLSYPSCGHFRVANLRGPLCLKVSGEDLPLRRRVSGLSRAATNLPAAMGKIGSPRVCL
ncbi:hypothetical protein Aph02nite_64740 [Actinoplanes philippinensis]|nr:hypothetical protein Aph02nite_64740 [Actinoplanes philippinensis]